MTNVIKNKLDKLVTGLTKKSDDRRMIMVDMCNELDRKLKKKKAHLHKV